MASRADRGGSNAWYLAKFGVTAALLVAGTLALVLGVLPQRYVLSAGFRESGRMFPDPAVPFTPLDPVRVAALPEPERRPPPPPGPAELLWSAVLPLLEAGRFDQAIPLFEAYLARHPDDLDARRELGITLVRAGRAEEGVRILGVVVERTADPSLRLLLARALRDLGRVPEASTHYAALSSAAPDDVDLTLEWSRAESWAERYGEAERVLDDALFRHPDDVRLRLELARLHYFTGRLAEADAILASLPEEELDAEGRALRDAVASALAVPEVEEAPPPPPTLLERAASAREADDFTEARALLAEALAADPDDAEAWLALANLLEYELSDFAGALEALRELERPGGSDAALQYRMAHLELWTDDGDAARARLERLLASLPAEPPPGDPTAADPAPTEPTAGDPTAPTRADVLALLGDLDRWDGDRIAAAHRYRAALASDPGHERAAAGVEAVAEDVDAVIDEVERPRVGGLTYALGDSDDYRRFEAGAEWTGADNGWAWSVQAGRRWLSGPPAAGPVTDLQGTFFDLSPARWWREGTIRTAARFGGEWVREGAFDPTLGLQLQLRPLSGGVVRLEYAHGPAYDVTATLQSASQHVTHDRLSASAEGPLSGAWTVAAQGDLARLDARDHDAPASIRTQLAVAVARPVGAGLSLGWTASVLTYSEEAPSSAEAPSSVDRARLYWDPSSALATGPLLTLRRPLGPAWTLSGRLNPGVARIHERETGGADGGPETVPHLSADTRLEFTGARLRSTIDLFYGQARVEGYRSFGARVSLGAGTGGR